MDTVYRMKMKTSLCGAAGLSSSRGFDHRLNPFACRTRYPGSPNCVVERLPAGYW
ncbi:hypothetical protein PISMIDRAFT_544139 [Pisolithus microcarpus 441]|uniref:Uncharacterized protein n=1 Tax=Pisolithus microcarpus 441 TaxID=765257 RepID=A0A0C9Z5H6_9AGAM|nr:hypothetical protein PISMIDRAFT_544139 [Pisolithus microcarpus 441]